MQEQHKSNKAGARQRELVSLCQLPFVLTPEAKARIMQGEALLQKQHQAQALSIQVSPTSTPQCCVASCSQCFVTFVFPMRWDLFVPSGVLPLWQAVIAVTVQAP